MLCFVTATDDLYGAQNIIKTLLKKEPRIKTVVQNINKRDTNVILGEKTRVLYGTGQIKDRLCGLDFLISAKSFYQTNSKLTETLYNTAINALQLTKEDTVLDAYCGTGTIGLAISKYVKEVVGVEIEHSSILDAEKNKKINNIENISFIEDDCTEYLMNNCEEGKYSAVVMDPPRAGSTKEFIAALEKISPRQIVYISCDPVTLARDLGYFTNYEIKRVIPVDMFPHTFHVETLVVLSKKIPDSHINIDVEFGEGKGQFSLKKIKECAESRKPKEKVTYKMIQEYIEKTYGFKVHTAYIAEVKRDLGLPMYDAPNAVEELKRPRAHPTPKMAKAIKETLKHFEII